MGVAKRRCINDKGLIVGTGFLGGTPDAYELVPLPEPCTFSMNLVASVIVSICYLRRAI